MGRLAALIEKELGHHGLVWVALALFLPAAWLLVYAGVALAPTNVTLLMTHTYFLWVFLPLTALVLGHRLVVVEYHGQTQLFIEALPLRRWEMVAVKYALGLVVVSLVAGLSLVTSALVASAREPIGGHFLTLMALRTFAFAFCLWAVLFAMGFLGRFRVPLYLAFLVILLTLDAFTDLELSRFGPFEMVGQQLVLDRVHPPPGSALALTLGIGALATALAAALALIHEGSVAESLARRMTLKEKSVVGVLLVLGLIPMEVLESKKEPAPFAFPEGEALLRSTGESLEILDLRTGAGGDGRQLLSTIEGDLEALRRVTGRASLPMARVVLRSSGAAPLEPVPLARRDGVLLRAVHDGSDPWAAGGERALRAALIRELLLDMTEGRADYEPRAWVFDGLGPWLVEADRRGRCEGAPASCPPLLRALWVTGGEGGVAPSAELLARWRRTRERLGAPVAEGLASSGLAAVERARGRDAVEALAQRLYEETAPRDLRAVITAWRHPMASLLRDATGLDEAELLALWRAELGRLRGQGGVAEALARVPEGRASLQVLRGEGALRALELRLSLTRPPPPETVVTVLHQELGPFDLLLPPVGELQREERLLTGRERGQERLELSGRYGPGTRVFVALELSSAALGCPARLLAERRALR